jgi:glyoxylase-like metal-dependent hydrolase (beta-lactamase superfamily II)
MSARIDSVNDGQLLLDGGAMFGVVPKVLWERKCPADDRNRILLGLHCLIIEGDGFRALVDTGVGDKGDEEFAEIYGLEKSGALLDALAAKGLMPADFTHVINTHLHFDHCGGNTRLNDLGLPQASFPVARYVVQQGEWEEALSPGERSRTSYLEADFLPLKAAELLDLVEGEMEILPGVTLIPTPGHTRHHQSILVQTPEGPVFHPGDLIPTSRHLALPWIMSYDLYPVETLESKRRILDRAHEEAWKFYFQHEPGDSPYGEIEWMATKKGEKPVFRPLPLPRRD